MKRILLASILLFGLILFFGCDEGKPDIQFQKDSYDFGEVQEGNNVDITYTFTNTGKGSLIIRDVKPDCGCTLTQNWDNNVAPGKSGNIVVAFSSQSHIGENNKKVDVLTNVPGKEKIELTLKGRVKSPEIDIKPQNLFLSEVGPDAKSTKELTGFFMISNNSKSPLRITEIIPPAKNVKYNLSELEKNQNYKLEFTIYPPLDGKGVVQKNFTLKTDNPKLPEFYLYFSYSILPPIEVFPKILRFDPQEVALSESSLEIFIRTNAGEPIKIDDLSVKNGRGINCHFEEYVENKSSKITVTIPKDYQFIPDKTSVIMFRIKNDPDRTLYSVSVESLAPAPTPIPKEK
jgi:hypothetical protein